MKTSKNMIKFEKNLLDNLSAQAKESPRLRATMDLRTTPNDMSQRVLNALEPGTVVPIHRHRNTTEVVVLIRGKVKQTLYDDNGKITSSFIVEAGSDLCGYSIDAGQWHTTECLVSGTIFCEAKDGAYEPLSSNDLMEK